LNTGIFSWFGYRMPLAERLKLIAEANFVSTSIWLGKEEKFVESIQMDDMPGMVRDTGLILDNAHAPFKRCNLLWSDYQSERDIIKAEYRECLFFCQRHTIPMLVVHITLSSNPPLMSKAGLIVLRDLVKYAEGANVMLAIENTRRQEYLDIVFEELDSPHLGLCYDSSHDFLYGVPPGSILKKWGHRLVTTHFSDNQGKRDDHWLPGEGTVDWELIKSCFPSDTYSGTFLLEVFPQSENAMSAQDFLNTAFQRAISLGQQLL
jgi:sugar phosphate isomerase/epimerase